MRKEHYEATKQSPFVLCRSDELINDDLRAIGEVAELRLPQDQGLGIIATVSILKAEHTGLRQDRVVYLVLRLLRREMIQRNVFRLVLDVDQHAVALVERAALAILSAETDRHFLEQERAKGQSLSHTVIEGALAMSHFSTLLQQLLDLGMDVKLFRIARQLVGNLANLLCGNSRFDIVFRFESAAVVVVPVLGKFG